MIKAIIFDYGNVITPESNCVDDIASVYGISNKTVEKKLKPFVYDLQKGKIKESKFWRNFSLALKKPIPKETKNLWHNCIERDFYMYPEMVNFVKKIKKQGIKTAVLSNTIKPHARAIRRNDGFKDFDIVVTSCGVKLRKPEPEIYSLTIKRLRVKPHECIFIDDKNEYIRPAKKLGMKTILAKNPKQVIHDVCNILS